MEIVNIEISMTNIKDALETFLRQMKVIKDSQDVMNITFGVCSDITKVTEWEAMTTVPLQLALKDEEVEVVRLNLNGKKR